MLKISFGSYPSHIEGSFVSQSDTTASSTSLSPLILPNTILCLLKNDDGQPFEALKVSIFKSEVNFRACSFNRGPITFILRVIASWNQLQHKSLISSLPVLCRFLFPSPGTLFSISHKISAFHFDICVLPTSIFFATARALFPLSIFVIASCFSFTACTARFSKKSPWSVFFRGEMSVICHKITIKCR